MITTTVEGLKIGKLDDYELELDNQDVVSYTPYGFTIKSNTKYEYEDFPYDNEEYSSGVAFRSNGIHEINNWIFKKDLLYSETAWVSDEGKFFKKISLSPKKFSHSFQRGEVVETEMSFDTDVFRIYYEPIDEDSNKYFSFKRDNLSIDIPEYYIFMDGKEALSIKGFHEDYKPAVHKDWIRIKFATTVYNTFNVADLTTLSGGLLCSVGGKEGFSLSKTYQPSGAKEALPWLKIQCRTTIYNTLNVADTATFDERIRAKKGIYLGKLGNETKESYLYVKKGQGLCFNHSGNDYLISMTMI
jgi:hypothetical protein